MHKQIPRAWVKQMKKYFLMLIALVTLSFVFISCERSNTPSRPNESYYDMPMRK